MGDEMDELFGQGYSGGMDGLAMEYVAVDHEPFYDDERHRDERYKLDEQREAFREEVTSFLADHQVMDVDITVAIDQDHYYNIREYEAWIVYQEDDADG